MARKRVWVSLLFVGLSASVAWGASTFYATCADSAHKAGWDGDVHPKRSDAEADCAAHLTSFPGHACKVEEVIR